MSCGCKQKKLPDLASQPKTLNRVKIVDGQVKTPDDIRPPDVLRSPVNINEIVSKINEILKPQI